MNLFDIVGPVMVGPSSSHTAGAVRIGHIARRLLNEPAAKAEIFLHGSFRERPWDRPGSDCRTAGNEYGR